MKQKITTFFVILCFLFSNIFYVRSVQAADFNQLAANVVNWAQDISGVIEKFGGGILKASLSTALNQFAKDLGKQTVTAIATGDWGQEPLYFNFSLEDTITAAVDNAIGSYLDEYIANGGIDLCKPIGAFDVNWKFKLMLNIIPDLNNIPQTTVTQYNCTVSKFVDNVKTSIDNIVTSIQKTFVSECFDEFVYNDVCSAGVGLYNIAANGKNPFSLDGIKKYYGYDTSSNFCKKTTYYLKNTATAGDFAKAVGLITLNNVDICSIDTVNRDMVDSNVWTTTTADCAKESSSSVFDLGKLTSSIFNSGTNGCLVSFDYCRFNENGDTVFDRAKQKKFINQYNVCYRAKVKEALGSLVEVGNALPTDKIVQQTIKDNCGQIISSFMDSTDATQKGLSIMKRAVMSENDGKFTFFLTKNISPAVYVGYLSVGNIFSDGEQVDAVHSQADTENFPFLKTIVFYEAKSWSDFQNQIGKNNGTSTTSVGKAATGYDVLYYTENDAEYFYYQNNGKLNQIKLMSEADYNSLSSANSANIKDYMINLCTNINNMNTSAYLAFETANDAKTMSEAQAQAADEKAKAEELAKAQYPQAGSFKNVIESISGQVKTPGSAVQKQFETSMDVGTNALQPTGDLFIDPIKIFLTTLLSEGSNSLLKGLFENIMPTVEEPELTDFDANEYTTTETLDNNTCDNDPSKFSNNTPCGANYQCQSCCCTTNNGSNTGVMYCLPIEYCK